jgi:hypothetical protein
MVRGEYRKLFQKVIIQMNSPELLSGNEIKGVRIEISQETTDLQGIIETR